MIAKIVRSNKSFEFAPYGRRTPTSLRYVVAAQLSRWRWRHDVVCRARYPVCEVSPRTPDLAGAGQRENRPTMLVFTLTLTRGEC